MASEKVRPRPTESQSWSNVFVRITRGSSWLSNPHYLEGTSALKAVNYNEENQSRRTKRVSGNPSLAANMIHSLIGALEFQIAIFLISSLVRQSLSWEIRTRIRREGNTVELGIPATWMHPPPSSHSSIPSPSLEKSISCFEETAKVNSWREVHELRLLLKPDAQVQSEAGTNFGYFLAAMRPIVVTN